MARVRERNGREGHKDDSHYQVTTQKRRKEEEEKNTSFSILKSTKNKFTRSPECTGSENTDRVNYTVTRATIY